MKSKLHKETVYYREEKLAIFKLYVKSCRSMTPQSEKTCLYDNNLLFFGEFQLKDKLSSPFITLTCLTLWNFNIMYIYVMCY